jgi:hypothetical protein
VIATCSPLLALVFQAAGKSLGHPTGLGIGESRPAGHAQHRDAGDMGPSSSRPRV